MTTPKKKTKIVGFLQNQWFKNPQRVLDAIARRPPEARAAFRQQFLVRALFAGCLTGERLYDAFGDMIEDIYWEEISKEIGDHSRSAFAPDFQHISEVLTEQKPDVVVTFGKIAEKGIADFVTREKSTTQFHCDRCQWVEGRMVKQCQLCQQRQALHNKVDTDFTLIAAPHPAARGPQTIMDLKAVALRVKQEFLCEHDFIESKVKHLTQCRHCKLKQATGDFREPSKKVTLNISVALLPVELLPGIKKAALEVQYDNGGINRFRTEEEFLLDLNKFIATKPYDMQPINAWLLSLSAEDFDEYCTGEVTNVDRIGKTAPDHTDELLTETLEL